MKLRKIRYILSIALVLSTVSGVSAYAGTSDMNSTTARGIIGDSVIIDKGESNGGSTLLPEDALDELSKPDGNIGTWGNEESSPSAEVPVNKGSIKVSLPDTSGKNDKANVKFSLSKVADVVDGEYKMLDSYSSANVDLNNLKNANDLEIAANMLKEVATSDTTLVTDSNGVCSIDDLDVGVYLLYATDIAKYENITPFLISIPVWNDADKTMSFDVEVIPKHTPLPVKEPEKSKAPSTGYDGGGTLFGVLSSISLIAGTGMLSVKKRKEE